jgi:hypothetical protein
MLTVTALVDFIIHSVGDFRLFFKSWRNLRTMPAEWGGNGQQIVSYRDICRHKRAHAHNDPYR